MNQEECARSFDATRRKIIRGGAAAWAMGPALAQAQLASAQAPEVAMAGLAFAGDAASMSRRLPYSLAYERAAKEGGTSVYKMMSEALAKSPPGSLKLVGQIDELKGRDQAIAVALVIGSETVSVEQLAGIVKLFALVRAQVVFFDFKSMAVVRAYPVSFAVIDRFDRVPRQDEIAARIRGVYEGAEGKPGLFSRFAATLARASLPQSTSRTLQVTRVALKPEALAVIPAYLNHDGGAVETWAADLVGEALSTRAGVPIVPYSKGYAVGNVMSMRIADGEVYNLKLPKPDYEIAVEITGFKKIKFGEAAAGASYIYGTYAALRIEEPLSGKLYMDTALKNGEVKAVPVTQTYVDDFPAYYDSINGLFVKLAETLDGKGNAWVKTAAAAPDIDKQITDTRELFRLCK